MHKLSGIYTGLCCLFLLSSTPEATAQPLGEMSGGDMLNEVPIWPVPAEMTFEEYTDAHRRLNVGLLLMSVPIPGSLHFYAGERKTGWKHVYAAGIGLAAIIAGAAMIDEKEGAGEKSDFETTDITGENDKIERYEKIPVKAEGEVFTYRLNKLDHKTRGEGAGGTLVVLGAGLIVGQLIHDWTAGIKTIERKRNAVRYKYGKSADYKLSLNPHLNLPRGSLGANLSLHF